jgi:hypothetical protein
MKKGTRLFLILFCSFCIIGCSLFDDYVTYEDNKREFSIKYPADWQVLEDDNPDSGVLVTFYKDDPEGVNVSVSYSKLFKVAHLKELVEINLNSLKKSDGYMEFHSGYEYVHKLQGYRHVYAHNSTGNEYKSMLYALVSGTNFYVITCTCDPETYNVHEKTFNKIIKKFKFRI